MGSTARKRFRRLKAAKIVPSRAAALRLKERQARPLPAHTSPLTGLPQTTTTTVVPRSRDRLDLLLQVPDDKRASFLRLHEDYEHPRLLNTRFAGYLDQIRAAAARGVHVSDPDYGRRARGLRAPAGALDARALLGARRRLLSEENALGLAVEHCGFGGLSMAEAGVVLGCSKSTVSRRVRQGLDLLERWLALAARGDGHDADADADARAS